jgi:hypothetical protein
MDDSDQFVPNEIEARLALAICAPINPGDYVVRDVTISVSYPTQITVGPQIIDLGRGIATTFAVRFRDTKDDFASDLRKYHGSRQLLFFVLERINELLIAYKLVRVGHLDGWGIRTVGEYDVICRGTLVDRQMHEVVASPAALRQGSYDPLETTALAKQHIATNTFPLARRYLRCFELLEHGFYSESLIVAFSILDDRVQGMLKAMLAQKGLSERQQDEVLRGIKENRLRIYLGSLLKVLTGRSVDELWPESADAIKWLNKKRNDVAHDGIRVNQVDAARSLYVCIYLFIAFHDAGLIDEKFPAELIRHATYLATTSSDGNTPPGWCPAGSQGGKIPPPPPLPPPIRSRDPS